jgi:hypothetical protein
MVAGMALVIRRGHYSTGTGLQNFFYYGELDSIAGHAACALLAEYFSYFAPACARSSHDRRATNVSTTGSATSSWSGGAARVQRLQELLRSGVTGLNL